LTPCWFPLTRILSLFTATITFFCFQSIEDEYQQKSIITKIVVDQEQITVLCTSKGEAGIIREKIQDFFQLNTENEIIIDLPPAQLKFLQEHMKDEVEKLERTLSLRSLH
jgi:ABC-type uncharacterized transport system YnjBCD ATPase subunit